MWQSNSTIEQPGPPTASATRLYLASPTGRLAALDLRTGKVTGTLPGRDESDNIGSGDTAAAPVLSGDALYVPYGLRSVYLAWTSTTCDPRTAEAGGDREGALPADAPARRPRDPGSRAPRKPPRARSSPSTPLPPQPARRRARKAHRAAQARSSSLPTACGKRSGPGRRNDPPAWP
ncbi:PQQ-like beta-propeller repeat protein [Streptomyces tricolor]|nr:PQQ-like beta-propeller repeat protein [Streptomyces tricolor]